MTMTMMLLSILLFSVTVSISGAFYTNETRPDHDPNKTVCAYPVSVSPGGCWAGRCEAGRTYWEPVCINRWGGGSPCLTEACHPGSGCDKLNMMARPRETVIPCDVPPRCVTLICGEPEHADNGGCTRGRCVRDTEKTPVVSRCVYEFVADGTPCSQGRGRCSEGMCILPFSSRSHPSSASFHSSSSMSGTPIPESAFHARAFYVLALIAISTGSFLLRGHRPFDRWYIRCAWVVVAYWLTVITYATLMSRRRSAI